MDTAGCIDTRSDFEYDITDSNVLLCQTTYIDDGFHSYTGVAVELFQTVMCQDTVFSHNRHDVRSDTDRYEIKQWDEMMKFDTVADSKCLHKFETYPASR